MISPVVSLVFGDDVDAEFPKFLKIRIKCLSVRRYTVGIQFDNEFLAGETVGVVGLLRKYFQKI